MIYGPKILVLIILFLNKYKESEGHGRLIEPPSRASMWRYGFNTPPNYNDHELYCGGFTRQYQTNGGKCGICGDPWDIPQPRPNEAGGKYGQGVIVRRYKLGQPIIVRVELTANHRGYFEFKVCPNNAPKQVASQSCLDKYILRRVKTKDADESFHETRFYPGTENKVYEMRYSLPEGMTCSQCVLQWKYIAGNNWGVCENGTGAVGCGPQEEFRACADISVSDKDGTIDTSPYPTPITVTTMATTSTEASEEENEIPDDSVLEKPKPQTSGFNSSIFIILSIVFLSLGFVLVVFIFVYWYFYHAGDTIKSWWRRMAESSYSCIRKSNNDEKKKNSMNEQPVPPPRVKKTTIGFKGVPDNLV
ncbi:Cellulose/chitin-binding protein, N-terminal [Cinara cedri]|uniref:Cellulose/chitin-binding protein, N-terminal n=1 Tax=Cinara cedri TaxID=506608 RepID=A0A5E4MTF1_9HEMI|nr:Cellulose/chitin-binding protein, N-terminal [Cinara cedri]